MAGGTIQRVGLEDVVRRGAEAIGPVLRWFLDARKLWQFHQALQDRHQVGIGEGATVEGEQVAQVLDSPRYGVDEVALVLEVAPETIRPPATFSKYDGKGPLVVRVFSFSFKKGIPEDPSGNGGGYVFDCRSTHNPGRYEPYKKLTGLDEPVIRFLEDDGEILQFLEHVYALADHHVNRYIQRGFTSLMFCFGCTGGQHRSVYSAQHLAEHIHEKFGVEVRICHREQEIEQVLPAKQ